MVMLLTSLICLRLKRCTPCVMYHCYSPDVMMVAHSHLHLDFSLAGIMYTHCINCHEKILYHRTGKRKNLKESLVKWEGCEPTNDLWQPEANIHANSRARLLGLHTHCAAS